MVVVLHLLSNSSCEVGAPRTDVAVTLVAGIGAPAAEVAGLVARPLPLDLQPYIHTLVIACSVQGCDRL